MISKNAIRLTIYGAASILAIKAIDASPLSQLFNGKWYIPLSIAVVLLFFAEKIVEKVGR